MMGLFEWVFGQRLNSFLVSNGFLKRKKKRDKKKGVLFSNSFRIENHDCYSLHKK
jgi:hypothetical protein